MPKHPDDVAVGHSVAYRERPAGCHCPSEGQQALIARIRARWDREPKLSDNEAMLLAVEELEPELRARAAARADGLLWSTCLAWSTPAGSGTDGYPLRLVPDGGWAVAHAGRQTSTGVHVASVAAYLRSWWRPYDVACQVVESATGCSVNTAVDTVFGRGA